MQLLKNPCFILLSVLYFVLAVYVLVVSNLDWLSQLLLFVVILVTFHFLKNVIKKRGPNKEQRHNQTL